MMNRIILIAAALSMTACATVRPDINIGELSNARAAIAAAKAAGAEQCAPKLQAQAVANLYWAAHELTENDIHPDENAELIATAESKAKDARAKAAKGCTIALNGVNFDSDSAELTSASTAILDRAAITLKGHGNVRVEVAAHTDSTASDAYNLDLSTRRAASVKDYLTSHGVDGARLSSKGYGESSPIASNATKAGRAQNRRVELRIQK